eukprot:5155931-Prorocentrum_lima.AAC.1
MDGQEELVVKPTGRATHSASIAHKLEQRCSNIGRPEWLQHRHAPSTGGRAKRCEVYPVKLVRAILE